MEDKANKTQLVYQIKLERSLKDLGMSLCKMAVFNAKQQFEKTNLENEN